MQLPWLSPLILFSDWASFVGLLSTVAWSDSIKMKYKQLLVLMFLNYM